MDYRGPVAKNSFSHYAQYMCFTLQIKNDHVSYVLAVRWETHLSSTLHQFDLDVAIDSQLKRIIKRSEWVAASATERGFVVVKHLNHLDVLGGGVASRLKLRVPQHANGRQPHEFGNEALQLNSHLSGCIQSRAAGTGLVLHERARNGVRLPGGSSANLAGLTDGTIKRSVLQHPHSEQLWSSPTREEIASSMALISLLKSVIQPVSGARGKSGRSVVKQLCVALMAKRAPSSACKTLGICHPLRLARLAGLLAQDCPVHIRAEFLALDAGEGFNVGAVLGRNLIDSPLLDNGVARQLQSSSHGGYTASNFDCSRQWGLEFYCAHKNQL